MATLSIDNPDRTALIGLANGSATSFTLETERLDSSAQPVLDVQQVLTDVYVTNQTFGSGQDGSAETLTFTFGKINETRNTTNPDGSLGTPDTFQWNFETNTPT